MSAKTSFLLRTLLRDARGAGPKPKPDHADREHEARECRRPQVKGAEETRDDRDLDSLQRHHAADCCGLSDDEMRELADYYAKLPPGSPPTAAGPARHARGEKIATEGIPSYYGSVSP
jgi:anaerobic selenocysteine-containing dehydrogenase